jgi:hypothetical protein
MPWTPLLEGPLAAAAATAVYDIARATAAAPRAHPAERTLFWAYATSLLDEPFAHAAYRSAVDDAIAALQAGVALPGLYDGGLAGLGFALSHVIDDGVDDALDAIDQALASRLAVDRWTEPYDLTHGLAGYGLYFLERLSASPGAGGAASGLDRVVRHLERSATGTPDGVAWRTTPATMPAEYRAQHPDGYYDCGVAHGVPGIIACLARAGRVAQDPRASALATDAVRWVVAQRQPPSAPGRFPTMVTDAGSDRARAAWCYGDPGIAAVLWPVSPELAHEIALDCATRDPASCGVRDTALCHGAAGLAHLYHRLFLASGDPALAAAARAWFARTLEMRDPGFGDRGVAGFAAWRGAAGWFPATGLLDGAIGIALALLAAITPAAPAWDRMLGCDLAM